LIEHIENNYDGTTCPSSTTRRYLALEYALPLYEYLIKKGI